MTIRMPAVSGAFYPAETHQLHHQLATFLGQANFDADSRTPTMLVVPHAGYVYSGQIAAKAYALLKNHRDAYRRVVVLGPSHRVALHGIAVAEHATFRTPLGDIKLDQIAISRLTDLPGVDVRTDAHALEHSLEVQLPFLQTLLDDFLLVPLVVGQSSVELVREAIEAVWDEQTLLVVSTDLSHFLYDADANRVDANTIQKILHCETSLLGEEACGHHPLNGALAFAKGRGWLVEPVAKGNSGDITGDKERVVGYASFAVYDGAGS